MADRGDLWAWKTIGINHEAEGNLSAAFAYYHYAAINGNGRSQQLLANAYRHGRGTEKNPFLAAFWFAVSVYVCDAEYFPQSATGLKEEVSVQDWDRAWTQPTRPRCCAMPAIVLTAATTTREKHGLATYTPTGRTCSLTTSSARSPR